MLKRRHFLKGSAALLLASHAPKFAMASNNNGFVVPPEEDKHELTFMQWPSSHLVYTDVYFLEIVQQTIADIANSIAEFEPVVMLAAKKDHSKARKQISSNVELWDIPTEDLWCRDSGPLFAKGKNGKLAISHIQFNGWGNKQGHKRDGSIAAQIAQRLNLELIPSGLKGEPGGIEQDGHGLLMAHESSWVNENRNPGLSRDQVEKRLLKAYGAEKMIWSPGVWGGDITDYHVDALARFTGPGRVLINLPKNPIPDEPFHIAALETHDRIVDAGLDVDVIFEPEIRRVKSYDFVASYANYYVCNGGVIAAQFGDKQEDANAVDALKKHYPGREIITLNVDALGEIGGGIHCATQQMPKSS